ncbi:MAG: polyprenol phosphomannose-dependent alpha 1,6 mannosyltransferase MptB [Solirubrobacteraceae bacterium]
MGSSPRSTWLCAALGFAGSMLVAYAAPRAVPDPVVHWWYVPAAPAGRPVSLVLVYVGMAALTGAWLALGRSLPSRRGLIVICAAWAIPLTIVPPLFSRDVYSYLAQGTILHLGHNPYRTAPSALAGLGREHVLAAVSPFWRGTTAPYGPLFLELISVVVGVVGSNLVAGVLLTRGLELLGLVLLAVSLPRLTRALGSDGRRGLWLGMLSPLVMLQLIAPGHNDLLMAGLLAAGVAVALDGQPLIGIAICALAATIKLPALAGAVFIAVAWGRAERGTADRVRFVVTAALVVTAILGAVTLIAGVGVSWISTSLLSTPAKVRLAVTPATGVGYTVASLLHDAGIATSARGWESAFAAVGIALTALIGLVLAARVTIARVVALLGAFLLLAAAAGPATWPWYFIWGLALIAALASAQRSTALAVAIAVSAFVVKPNGILALPLRFAPGIVILYAVLLAGWWVRRDRGDHETPTPGARPVRESTPSALAGS